MKGLEVDVAVVVCVGVEDNVPENLNKNCLRKPGQYLQFVALSKFSWFPDLHSDDCIDEEEHSNEQDDVRQRLREEKMIATTIAILRTKFHHQCLKSPFSCKFHVVK